MRKMLNIAELKIRLILDGLRIDDSMAKYEQDYLYKRYYYGKSDRGGFSFRAPQEILLSPTGIVVGITINNASPWIIKADRNSFAIYNKGDYIAEAYLPKKPKFYDAIINGGKKRGCDYLSLYSAFVLSAFLKGACDYFIDGLQCHFCSLQPTRHEFKDGEMLVSPEGIKETSEVAAKYDYDRIACANFCSGTWKDRDFEIKYYSNALRAMCEAEETVGSPKIKKHLVISPPNSIEQLKVLKESGATSIGMSIEVFDPKRFNEICPGKANNTGYKGFLSAYENAVKVFGAGNVYSDFICGLESIESMILGMESMGKMGVVPAANIFHPNPNSKLEHEKSPEFSYVREACLCLTEIYRKYQYKPPVSGLSRNSFDGEAYMGYFLEEKDFEKPEPLFIPPKDSFLAI